MNQRMITARKRAIYGKGMKCPAALVLARQHNEFNSIQRCTSFPEMAACYRMLLFSHFCGEGDDDALQCQSIILQDIEYSNKSA